MNQPEIDEYIRQGTQGPVPADDARRQEWIDRYIAALLSAPAPDIAQPDFSQATPALDIDPEAANWPASGARRIPRDHEPPLPEVGPIQVTARSRRR